MSYPARAEGLGKYDKCALSSAVIPGQSGPGSNGDEVMLRIPQGPPLLENHRQVV